MTDHPDNILKRDIRIACRKAGTGLTPHTLDTYKLLCAVQDYIYTLEEQVKELETKLDNLTGD